MYTFLINIKVHEEVANMRRCEEASKRSGLTCMAKLLSYWLHRGSWLRLPPEVKIHIQLQIIFRN